VEKGKQSKTCRAAQNQQTNGQRKLKNLNGRYLLAPRLACIRNCLNEGKIEGFEELCERVRTGEKLSGKERSTLAGISSVNAVL
jgi:hypothetical protein